MLMFCALKVLWWPRDLKTAKAMAAAEMSAITTTAAINLPLCFLASPRTMAALPEPLAEDFAEEPEPDGGATAAAAEFAPDEPGAAAAVAAARFVELKLSVLLACVLLELESRCRRFRWVRRSAAVW